MADSQNVFVEARGAATDTLKSTAWDSGKIAVASGFGAMVAVGGVVAALVQAQMLERPLGWGALTGTWLVFPVVYIALEFKRMHDRSSALRRLLQNHVDFELRILELTEQSELRAREVVALRHEAAALRSTLLTLSMSNSGGPTREQ